MQYRNMCVVACAVVRTDTSLMHTLSISNYIHYKIETFVIWPCCCADVGTTADLDHHAGYSKPCVKTERLVCYVCHVHLKRVLLSAHT
jgi:hypothetical protein